ncbi:RNA polymerase sigma factor [Dysosmobacter sp.]
MPTDISDKIRSSEEFERIYKEHYALFLRYAKTIFDAYGSRYVSASGRAEEAVQEMFAFAWENRETMHQAPSPIGWMYKCLAFKVQELLREDRIWAKRILQISEQHSEQGERDFCLKAELENMISPEDYLLLKHLYLDGYTYTEVCTALGLKKSTLAMRVKRIKERFMDDYGTEQKVSSKKK